MFQSDLSFAKAFLYSSSELALSNISVFSGKTSSMDEFIKYFRGLALIPLFKWTLARANPWGSQIAAKGSGKRFSLEAKAVAILDGSLLAINCRRPSRSISGRSQASTNHATWGN